MAYVRTHGNQIAIVHGERDPETRNVRQRTLFTLCSKPEARAALAPDDGWRLDHLLEQRYPRIRFDWDKIRAGIEERMDALPDIYPYRQGEILGRFRDDLCAFTRQLGLADPQCMYSAADLIRQHRMELEYVRDLIDWRLAVCDQEPNEWNGDNPYFWRRRLQSDDVPSEVLEEMGNLWAERDLDRLEALARLFIECYEQYADGHNYLGLIAQERGELEAAIAYFLQAMDVGRELFPRRLAKKHYWADHDTRPYMRALRNLTVATMLLTRYGDALALCDQLEQECGDRDTAIMFRAHIYLNMGRWSDARREAERLVTIWPEHAYLAAFAAAEQGEWREALSWFVHGALTLPRTGRMLVGQPVPRPEGIDQVVDHNTGVQERNYLDLYLARRSPAAQEFFSAILDAPTTRHLLSEAEEVVKRRHEQHPTGEREAFDRMTEMRSVAFAREAAVRIQMEVLTAPRSGEEVEG